jgi:hypothetical protein
VRDANCQHASISTLALGGQGQRTYASSESQSRIGCQPLSISASATTASYRTLFPGLETTPRHSCGVSLLPAVRHRTATGDATATWLGTRRVAGALGAAVVDAVGDASVVDGAGGTSTEGAIGGVDGHERCRGGARSARGGASRDARGLSRPRGGFLGPSWPAKNPPRVAEEAIPTDRLAPASSLWTTRPPHVRQTGPRPTLPTANGRLC